MSQVEAASFFPASVWPAMSRSASSGMSERCQARSRQSDLNWLRQYVEMARHIFDAHSIYPSVTICNGADREVNVFGGNNHARHGPNRQTVGHLRQHPT